MRIASDHNLLSIQQSLILLLPPPPTPYNYYSLGLFSICSYSHAHPVCQEATSHLLEIHILKVRPVPRLVHFGAACCGQLVALVLQLHLLLVLLLHRSCLLRHNDLDVAHRKLHLQRICSRQPDHVAQRSPGRWRVDASGGRTHAGGRKDRRQRLHKSVFWRETKENRGRNKLITLSRRNFHDELCSNCSNRILNWADKKKVVGGRRRRRRRRSSSSRMRNN